MLATRASESEILNPSGRGTHVRARSRCRSRRSAKGPRLVARTAPAGRASFVQVVAECYVRGVSTRRVEGLVRTLGIERLSISSRWGRGGCSRSNVSALAWSAGGSAARAKRRPGTCASRSRRSAISRRRPPGRRPCGRTQQPSQRAPYRFATVEIAGRCRRRRCVAVCATTNDDTDVLGMSKMSLG